MADLETEQLVTAAAMAAQASLSSRSIISENTIHYDHAFDFV
jgi:hypothetical protein